MNPQQQTNRLTHNATTARYEAITNPDARQAISDLISIMAAMSDQIKRLIDENNDLSRALTIANPNHRILKRYQEQ